MSKIIVVDFDGTCVTHEYPAVGKDIGAQEVLQRLTECGHKVILFTMRSGVELENAVNWFKEHNIELFGVNQNPEQSSWTQSPKPYGHIYIDDAGLGIPLILEPEKCKRAYVNWGAVSDYLKMAGYY